MREAVNSLFVMILWSVMTVSIAAQDPALKLPHVFTEHMVLQRDQSVSIWGWGTPGNVVQVSFADMQKSAEVNDFGQWLVTLDPLPASNENRTLTVQSGEQRITVGHVLVGEVWVASGQSNMEWKINRTDLKPAEIAQLDYPTIRMLTVKRNASAVPLPDVAQSWYAITPETAPTSSAVALHFAARLQQELQMPIGIISTAWGGTRIEPWTAPAGLEAMPAFIELAESVRNRLAPGAERAAQDQAHIDAVRVWLQVAEAHRAAGRIPPPLPEPIYPEVSQRSPAALYNAMIHPFVGMAMRGVIWYQGESNMGEGKRYEQRMQALVQGWRSQWGIGDFPFYFVQLAPFSRYSGVQLGEMWEAQLHASRSIVNAGMVVTTDIGNLKDIHPKNKRDVGYRLARWALAKQYGKSIAYSGPLYRSATAKDDALHIHFDFAENGLGFTGAALTDVYVRAADDEDFVPAITEIMGDTLLVRHPEGKQPQHARMGWNKNAQPNLVNAEGLPASPFRTDK